MKSNCSSGQYIRNKVREKKINLANIEWKEAIKKRKLLD